MKNLKIKKKFMVTFGIILLLFMTAAYFSISSIISMNQIQQSADQVNSGSEQVSSGAQALSQGSTEQASSIEELSSTITEMADQIKNTADYAKVSNEVSSRVGSSLQTGIKQMNEMTNAMEEITDTSNEIGKIIKTIEILYSRQISLPLMQLLRQQEPEN